MQGFKVPLSLIAFLVVALALAGLPGSRSVSLLEWPNEAIHGLVDTNDPDSTLPYPIKGDEGINLKDPANYGQNVEYNEATGQYIVTQKIGGLVNKPPMIMTPEEYREYIAKKQVSDYWGTKTQGTNGAANAGGKDEGRDPGSSLIPQIQVNNKLFATIFGSNTIDIRPQGYAELRFGGRFQKVDNPLIPERNRSTFTFDFKQRIQMNISGKIGERLTLATNYDTEATFSFENQTKLEYTGGEDDIIKKIELGNVSLPLNSSLISGAQSLFGVKGQYQFGKLTLTSVFSEQQSQSSSINVQGGATTTDFEINADQYEANRHYFLSQYFRDRYEAVLATRPLTSSPVQITKVEVWVTNTRQSTENTRNIVAFMDLGERDGKAYRSTSAGKSGPNIFGRFFPYKGFPDNRNNALDPKIMQNDIPGVRDISRVTSSLSGYGFEEAVEFTELSNARKLNSSEFNFDPQLGFISLNSSLNQDEVLSVSYQFTAGGKTYQVGEFSTDGVAPPNTLITKMLKSTILNVKVPMWDLMMKNVYSLNAYQVNREDFRLDILYRNDETGTPIPFLPEGNLSKQLLLRVTGLDTLNNNNDPQPDGFFDFIQGVTISPQNGRIYFPVLEPFGSNLSRKLNEEEIREKYVFQQLYDSTRFKAQNETRLNKYILKGQFKSTSSSEISLNAFNIPKGSVKVTAGGQSLTEGVQYTVDYNLGKVKIIDDGILNSGVPIKVDFENNALFNFQTKTFIGLNGEYKFNDNINLGATMVRMSEKPLTQKVNIGDEPIANTMWGLNGSYSKEAPYLTRFVDAIPFIDTKAKSTITANAEFAQLVPGSPRGIEIDGEATTYLDDFESSQTTIDLRNPLAWRLASTPGGQPDAFPEYSSNGLEYGYNRARLAWYTIDPLFHNETNAPSNINSNKDLQSGQDVRRVLLREIFPNVQRQASDIPYIPVMDMAFYPSQRGPYNFDVEPTTVSAGMDPDNGQLLEPRTRWAGVMRDLSTTNFEEQNIEFVQFWILDPYSYNQNRDTGLTAGDGGDIYLHLGSVSEDILRDGKQAVENGYPANGDLTKLDSTYWGYAPKVRPTVVTFDNDNAVRNLQDVGYDLLDNAGERAWKSNGNTQSYLERVGSFATLGQASVAYAKANADPASDDFAYYRGTTQDQNGANILERYRRYNSPQGNSRATQVDGVSAFATNSPDIEDINNDQTLSKTEAYYQYRISMRETDLDQVGENYITDIIEIRDGEGLPDLPNGNKIKARWIQFKVPVFSPDKKVGPINDFRSVRFARLIMSGFSKPVVVRMARMELVRGEWRRYTDDLDLIGDQLGSDKEDGTLFEVNAVNIEQNGSRSPIPYVLPPGIDRQVLFGTTQATKQNEQSLSLRVGNLQEGAGRAVFRNFDFDMRNYNRLRMFAHAEDGREGIGDLSELRDGELELFIRLGSDYNQNYYEYKLPLMVTSQNGSHTDEDIWPEANNVDFALDVLKEVKLERNREYRGNGNSLTVPYEVARAGGLVRVVGAPNLGNVRTILIGVRNPRKRLASDADPGTPVFAEVWINELRLTEFDQRGGWAANARVAAQLADFANISISGRTSSVGFGGIDQSVSERQKEQMVGYDFQSNFELGKFFSKESGLRVPMFFSQGEEWKNPQFNPLDPDIEFQDALDNLETNEDKETLKKIAQDYTQRKSINFTNVRKERTGAKAKGPSKPWGIENFSATYSFNEVVRRNISTKVDLRRDHKANLNYTYRTNAKPVEPLKNVSFLQSKHLSLIKDINFNYLPKQVSVIGSIDRSSHKLQMRNTDNPTNPLYELPITYNNSFGFDRKYSVLYDLTRALKIDFNANMRTRVDELVGIDPITGLEYTDQQKKDEMWKNFGEFGRPTNYHQTLNVNWQVPINKLPYFDFVNVQARYSGDYDWAANTLLAQQGPDSLNFGNTIQNSQTWQLNNNFNLIALYNKVPYLKKVNDGGKPQRGGARSRNPRTPVPESRAGAEKEEEEEKSTATKILEATVRTLMMTRNASLNYTRTRGTQLPGFKPTATFMGTEPGQNGAPGFGFVFGDQRDIRGDAVDNDWLVRTHLLNNPYTQTFNENLTARVTLEPVKGLRLVLNASRTNSYNESEFFRWNDEEGFFDSQNPFRTENFSMSYFMLPSAFEKLEGPDYSSTAYQEFLDNRILVSERLAIQYAQNDTTGYVASIIGEQDSSNYGYRYFSHTATDVLIPSFLAAYSGKDAKKVSLLTKPRVPLPNWTLTYDGLGKIKKLKKWFNNVTLNHGYRSMYTVSNISTNLLREQALEEFPDRAPLDHNGDLLAENQIGAVVLTENFSPLLGVNVKLKNNATIKLEYKKNRNISLSMANAQVTETKGSEWVIGAGYIFKDVRLKFVRIGVRKSNPVSNLELKVDVGIRDNITVIRKIVEDIDQVTAGQKVITLKFSADYQMSKRVTTKLFYDLNLSRFKTSNAYPLTTHQFGISLRLNLGS